MRFGVVGTPAPEERVAATAKLRPRGTDDRRQGDQPPAKLRRKMQRLQRLIGARAQRDGRPTQWVRESMRRVERSMRAGRVDEAENILDDMLTRLEVRPRGKSDDPAAGLRRRLERLHQHVQRLLRAGEIERAEKLLDQSLKLFKENHR